LDEQSILKTESLNKTYWNQSGKTVALDDVSLEVTRGELLAVYGPSGSGKTTLLFLLGGFDKPTSGRILLDGIEISNLGEDRLSKIRRRIVGFVFQNYNLVDELTVRENVGLTMMFEGRPQQEIVGATDHLIEKIGLVEKRRHRPSQLSAGEQQRVAIARALANGPQLVLMDEPTGNLDLENSRTVLDLVTDIMQNDGVTFVVATHNLDIVRGTSARLFLKAGKAAADVLSNS
jgi:putative ABC transport system ATP-binding protein